MEEYWENLRLSEKEELLDKYDIGHTNVKDGKFNSLPSQIRIFLYHKWQQEIKHTIKNRQPQKRQGKKVIKPN